MLVPCRGALTLTNTRFIGFLCKDEKCVQNILLSILLNNPPWKNKDNLIGWLLCVFRVCEHFLFFFFFWLVLLSSSRSVCVVVAINVFIFLHMFLRILFTYVIPYSHEWRRHLGLYMRAEGEGVTPNACVKNKIIKVTKSHFSSTFPFSIEFIRVWRKWIVWCNLWD